MPEPDEIDAQLQRIAKMLREARAPLIYGLTRLTVEAQELAVELAMCLRGAIDTPRGHLIPARGTSLQLQGEAHTTLGELRQYADLLIFVDCEPWKKRPDFAESWAFSGTETLPQKAIFHLALKRVDDNEQAESAELGNEPKTLLPSFVRGGFSFTFEQFVNQVCELYCRNCNELLALRKKLTSSEPTAQPAWDELLTAWQTAKYPVLVYQPAGLSDAFGRRGGSYLIEQLERAVLERASHGRAAAWPLEEIGNQLSNAAGAEYVLIARTGYPCAVQFTNGRAEYLPGVTNAEALLMNGEADIVLFLGEQNVGYWHRHAWNHRKPLLISARWPTHWDFVNPDIYLQCRGLQNETSGTIIREDGIPFQLPLSEAAKKSWSLSTESLVYLEQGEEAEAAELASTEASKTAPRMEDLLRRLLEFIREPVPTARGASQ